MKADTLDDLARRLRVPPRPCQTVARHNGFARPGKDEDFGKGSDAYQRNLGDPATAQSLHRPDRATAVLRDGHLCQRYRRERGPRHQRARAGLETNGSPIAGLYACGNDMASIMAGAYPGPGITIGPGDDVRLHRRAPCRGQTRG